MLKRYIIINIKTQKEQGLVPSSSARGAEKSMSDAIVVITTVTNKDEALELGKLLLTKRLIGCAQVSGPVQSLYWWKGKIEQDEEYRLIMKSRAPLWQMLEEEIRLNHPYDIPEILATPVSAVNKDYEEWLLEELRK